MNTDDTQAPAGRETDAKVARAMGYRIWLDPTGTYSMNNSDYNWKAIPTYSADTPDGYAAMREMLAWLWSQSVSVTMSNRGDFWRAQAESAALDIFEDAPSLPLAVCRLVLAVAKGEEKP